MKKLNSVVYHKLLLQAEEAKEQKLTKLASGIMNALGPYPEDETVEYAYGQLNEDVHQEMWKLATHVIQYYGIESVDAQKLDEVLESLANKFVNELESSLGVESVVKGPFEPKVPGESK